MTQPASRTSSTASKAFVPPATHIISLDSSVQHAAKGKIPQVCNNHGQSLFGRVFTALGAGIMSFASKVAELWHRLFNGTPLKVESFDDDESSDDVVESPTEDLDSPSSPPTDTSNELVDVPLD